MTGVQTYALPISDPGGGVAGQDHGLTARVEGDTVVLDAQTSEQAWAVGAWGVARAIDTGVVRVSVGDQQWSRSRSGSALTWHSADSTGSATRVVLALR